MSKNILIFSDGTGQAGGLRPDQKLSNVYKLYRATRIGPDSPIDPSKQIAFYDPGLGTENDAGRIPIRPVQLLRKFASSATGLGLTTNIADCYEAILRHYEPGDRIYLFGFSRGAYTARCVAGVLALCGVPTRGADGLPCPKYGRSLRAIAEEAVVKVYEHGAGKPREAYEAERTEQARRFREKYGCGHGDSVVVPYFVGVFDTVAALGASGVRRHLMRAILLAPGLVLSAMGAAVLWYFGLPFLTVFAVLVVAVALIAALKFGRTRYRVIRDFPEPGDRSSHIAGWSAQFYDKHLNKRVQFARHALAIDETRADFDRVPWALKGNQPDRPNAPDWLRQFWFAGNHSDIGGSYVEEESRLSDIALEWMVEQVDELPCPIIIDRQKLNLFPSVDGMQHCEVESLRDWISRWFPARLRPGWKVALRDVPRDATLHPSVLERFELGEVRHLGQSKPYRPEALRGVAQVSGYYLGSDAPAK